MSNRNLRITIPKTIEGKLKLASLIYKKHLEDGKNSPLHTLSDYNWNELGPKVQAAVKKHAEAEEHARLAELCYRERDQMMGDIDGLNKSSRDLLKGVYKKTPKKLVEWGFDVSDTPRGKK